MALGHFERHVNTERLGERVGAPTSRMTPRMFEFQIMEQARKKPMRIVLPEGEEERILRAAEILIQRGAAELVLLGSLERVNAKIRALNLNLEGVRVLQPELSPDFEDFVATYHELRKAKGITPDQARDRMTDPTFFGTMMVYKDQADGLVSGSVNTTAHTVRPALEFIRTKPGYSIVSSIFFMCLKDRVLTFGDCAINPDPTPGQLADIAVNAAETSRIFGLEPRVAMLSYSTGASGSGADVDKIVEATRIARERAPDLPLTGPIQYDAAIDPATARTKMPGDPVAGKATVFIFPDLNAGNNTYKAVQRAAGAIAIGPVLQGLRKPVNDLSRGATVPDIVNTVAITAVQAQAERGFL
jgi:phosphate acetyltransferase